MCYQLWDFPLDLSQPITGSLQCLEVSGKGCCVQSGFWQSCKLTGLWLELAHLNIGPALWLKVGPLWKTRGILQYKILPGGSPLSYWVLSQSEFLSFVTMSFWVLSQFVFLRFVTIWLFEFCHNFSFLSLSQFEFLSFVTIGVFKFCHNLCFFLVLSQFMFKIFCNLSFWVLSQF